MSNQYSEGDPSMQGEIDHVPELAPNQAWRLGVVGAAESPVSDKSLISVLSLDGLTATLFNVDRGHELTEGALVRVQPGIRNDQWPEYLWLGNKPFAVRNPWD